MCSNLELLEQVWWSWFGGIYYLITWWMLKMMKTDYWDLNVIGSFKQKSLKLLVEQVQILECVDSIKLDTMKWVGCQQLSSN